MKTITMGLAWLMLAGTAHAVDPLVNGDFEDGQTGWVTFSVNGVAEVTADIVRDSSVGHVWNSTTLAGEPANYLLQGLSNYTAGDVLVFSGEAKLEAPQAWPPNMQSVGFFRWIDAVGEPVRIRYLTTRDFITTDYESFELFYVVNPEDEGALYVGIGVEDVSYLDIHVDDVEVVEYTVDPTSVRDWMLYR